jgi:type III secretory pathway component EscV
MTKRFTAIILIANVIMGLLLYLSSQVMLSEINGYTLSGYSITSFNITPTQIAGQATVPIAFAPFPNFPFYVFVLFLIVNACFIIKLLISKETKQNPS